MPTVNYQGYNAESITPSDSQNLSLNGNLLGDNSLEQGASLYIGNGGNVRVTMLGGQTVTFANIQSGTFMPIQVVKVWATGTTATNIVELF
jgi:hypothetical protein